MRDIRAEYESAIRLQKSIIESAKRNKCKNVGQLEETLKMMEKNYKEFLEEKSNEN